MNPREQKFYDALKDIFVGAKVEGESGYINLMRIKSRYFTEGVFPRLQKDIDAACAPFDASFREELFDKLYTFFSRYFSESGSIYFRHTHFHQNIYEKVYTDDKDVMLFWKTHMLYYVKTDRLFQNLDVEMDGIKFFFDVSALEHKKANEKREIVYEFKEKRDDGTLVFVVAYSERGRKTKTDEILRELKNLTPAPSPNRRGEWEEVLERAFRVFEKQSEVDYFINKNAKAFLREQFDLWLYQYVFSGESVWTETRIQQLQTLKRMAYSIIDFISQFEDELVRIWNKPKFVLNSNYVITLDKLLGSVIARSPEGATKQSPRSKNEIALLRSSQPRKNAPRNDTLVETIFAHPNFKAQLDEWKQLGIVDEDFKKSAVFENTLEGKRLAEKYRYLPVDTKFFKDLELEILALFDNLDDALDGWLIKSENYQALNTILPKFRGKVQAIYIDPPYNASESEILYENEYKHSSWLCLIEERVMPARDILSEDGIFCVTIDDYESHGLRFLLDQLFSLGSYLATVVVRNNPSGRSTVRGFAINHEYALFYSKDNSTEIGRLSHSESQLARYDQVDQNGKPFEWENFRKSSRGSERRDRPKQFYPIYYNEKQQSLRIPALEWQDKRNTWKVLDEPQKKEVSIYPIDESGTERVWNFGIDRATEEIGQMFVRKKGERYEIYKRKYLQQQGTLPRTWWDNPSYSARDNGTRILKDVIGASNTFDFPKSVDATGDCLRVSNLRDGEICLDFFAGSGTTAHAVINLNREDGGKRKYILVEMADYFDTVILPRIKKVVFCEKWKDGKAAGGEGLGHFVKYYSLEQYEDALRRVKYDDSTLFDNPYQDPYNQYVFLRDLKMLDALDVDLKANKVKVDLARLYDGIDIPETLSNLTGKWIKRVTRESVEFADGETVDLQNLDWKAIKPLIWW